MKFVIIGGGAAGMSAASKAKRTNKEASVTVIESGNFVSYAECGIPYYVEGIFDDYSKLLHYPLTEFTEKRGIEVLTNRRVTAIRPNKKEVSLADGTSMSYDKLLIATGSRPKIPEQFREFATTVRSLESGIALRERVEKIKNVTMVGAGLLGIELAASLATRGLHVRIVSKYDRILPSLDDDMGRKFDESVKNRFEIEYMSQVKAIKKTRDKFSVTTSNGDHKTDLVLFATGIEPNSELASDAGLETDERGLIKVNRELVSSDESIYAAGDVAQSIDLVSGKPDWHPSAQVSNKMGRVAGSNVGGRHAEFPGALGTSLVKIFDYEVGFTGLNERKAKEYGYDYATTFIKAGSRANYYPGREEVLVKILFDKKTERIIGGQIIGKDGGAWRLNTLATAIHGKFTLQDLFNTDLGYTPPFGPVWDPLIIAASVSMRD